MMQMPMGQGQGQGPGTTIRLPSGDEQVPAPILAAARAALQKYGATDDPAALAAFLAAARDPNYRQQVMASGSSPNLPPGVAAAVQAYLGGAGMGSQSGLSSAPQSVANPYMQGIKQ